MRTAPQLTTWGRSLKADDLTEEHMNLARLVDEHLAEHGDHESIYFEGKWYSTGESHARIRAIAAGLRSLGVEPGDRVAVLLPNCIEVGLIYWATWRIGAAATPIIFLLPPPEVKRILSDSEAKVLITSPELLLTSQVAADGVDTLKQIVCIDPPEGENVMAFEDLEKHGEADIADRAPDDLAALLYTGGTTGASKGVMLSHNNLEWTARTAAEAAEIEPDEVSLSALPLSHSFGLHVSIAGSLLRSKGILMRWFDPNGMLDLIEEFGVQRMAVVPTMLQMLLATGIEGRDLSSLTSITSGAAGLPNEVLRAWEEKVPNCPLVQGYGLSETSPTVSVQRASSARDGTRAIGSVGKVIDGCSVRIADEDDKELPTGEVGEITIKGPNVMLGYWRNTEATAEAIKNGWFHSGDMGNLDADGNLYIVERKKDLIIRGGFNVYPKDVEGVLLEHPAVGEAAVVGRDSAKFGEEPVAFIVPKAGAEVSEEDLLAYGEEKLAKYKRPVEVRIVTEIPKTPVGKIDKKVLRTQL
ncbi:MAG: class I adenylate-forming enzyme family protein [Actinomycetota bacterium]